SDGSCAPGRNAQRRRERHPGRFGTQFLSLRGLRRSRTSRARGGRTRDHAPRRGRRERPVGAQASRGGDGCVSAQLFRRGQTSRGGGGGLPQRFLRVRHASCARSSGPPRPQDQEEQHEPPKRTGDENMKTGILLAAAAALAVGTANVAHAADAPVALIIAQGGLGDGSWNDTAYKGFEAALEETGLEGRPIESKDVVGQGEEIMRRAADAGFGLVISLEWVHGEP